MSRINPLKDMMFDPNGRMKPVWRLFFQQVFDALEEIPEDFPAPRDARVAQLAKRIEELEAQVSRHKKSPEVGQLKREIEDLEVLIGSPMQAAAKGWSPDRYVGVRVTDTGYVSGKVNGQKVYFLVASELPLADTADVTIQDTAGDDITVPG